MRYKYIIVGGGLTGASAIKGIREKDEDGAILLVGKEPYFPYHRPPLTKGLWSGKKKIGDIFIETSTFYEENGVNLQVCATVTRINPERKSITTDTGEEFTYHKLLLATGGVPRKLPVPGGDSEKICYYRYLDDYENVRAQVSEGASCMVIGGGFIGSEIAASLSTIKNKVTLLFPDDYICKRVFPADLAEALVNIFRERNVAVYPGNVPVKIEEKDGSCVIHSSTGELFRTDIVVAGLGIEPDLSLARSAGLQVANGIIVNEQLQTSNPDIFAAGDVALFPYQALHRHMRVEHWDNALNQGILAGKNMAGASDLYTYMPYFFSDLFEFGYEAVGDVTSELETVAFWKQKFQTGIIYYLQNQRVRGVMLCNIWGKIDIARELITMEKPISKEDLSGAISL